MYTLIELCVWNVINYDLLLLFGVLHKNKLWKSFLIICRTKFSDSRIKMIETLDNKVFIIFDGYPYYKKNVLKTCDSWACTRSACSAYIHVDRDNMVTLIKGTHKHNPTKYFQLASGKYVKI